MEVFDHPNCPATYPTPDISHSAIPIKPVHNDALIYLAVAVATFAAVPSLLWLRDQRHKARERRRSRVVVESIKAKMDTVKALETVSAPAPAPKPSVVDVPEECDAEDVKDKKKRTKDRRKRNRDPSSTRLAKKSTRPPLPARHGSQATDYTPRAPEQSNLSSPPMPNIVSPKPMSLISSSFHPPSPSPTRSENCSRAGRSRSASTSSTTAPLTPPSLPSSHSLPHNIIKENNDEAWALQLPHNDPAWDWDGQSSAYSSGSRAPSTSSCVKPSQGEEVSSPSSPASPLLPSAPSLVFPSLNAHPPPGASLSTQIASLTGALEASRTREDMHRREAERWSKECDLVKWRWNEASDLWRRRETELQAQIHHLMHQVQTLTHSMQAATLSPPLPLSYAPGQPPFPHAMPFPSLHHPMSPFINGGIHPFLSNTASHGNERDTVTEGLAEAILKRPNSIRPSTTPRSGSRSSVRQGEPSHETRSAQATTELGEFEASDTADGEPVERVVEFEFPTLLERPVPTPPETVVNVDGVEIFN